MEKRRVKKVAASVIALLSKKYKKNGLEGMPYKNEFLDYTVKDNVVTLYFYLKPSQSFKRHLSAANRKLNQLIKHKIITVPSLDCDFITKHNQVVTVYQYTFKK